VHLKLQKKLSKFLTAATKNIEILFTRSPPANFFC